MRRLWAACLIIIGLNALILAVPNLWGEKVSDAMTLIIGAIDLIACPILVYTSLKLYMKK